MSLRLRAPHLPRRKTLRRPPVQGGLALEIVRGRVKRRLRPIKGPVFLLGSASDCDLVLGDPRFPDAYAYIYEKPDGSVIRYLGAGPVLEVDGRTAETCQLRIGSHISAGPFEFVVHRDDHSFEGSDDDTELAFTPESPREEENSAAVDIVRALLADVRRKVLPPPAPLAAFRRRASA